MTGSEELIERLRASALKHARRRGVLTRPTTPCAGIVTRGEGFLEPNPSGGGFCREIHPDGHQCTWRWSLHQTGAKPWHRCRGCRTEWKL